MKITFFQVKVPFPCVYGTKYAPATQSVRAACRMLKFGRRLPPGYLRDAEEDEKIRIANAHLAKLSDNKRIAVPVKRSFWRRLIGAK